MSQVVSRGRKGDTDSDNQSTKSWRPVLVAFHGVTASTYGYAICWQNVSEVAHRLYMRSNPSVRIYGRWRFLTYNCLMMQFVAYSLCFTAHFVPRLRKPRDYFFTTFALPVGMLVVSSFWAIWFIAGREVILPASLEPYYPPWLNHVTHTIIAPINLIELLIVKKEYPSDKLAITALAGYTLSYTSYLLYIRWQTGRFVYPFLNQMNASSVGAFITARNKVSTLLRVGRQQVSLSPLSKKSFNTGATISSKSLLNPDNINQNVRRLEYAVRGPLVIRATQLKRDLSLGEKKPFKSVISANIGDCHAMNQKPITFIRQVLACAADTSLLNSSSMPNDVKERVRDILSYCGGQSIGAYTESCGIEIVRKNVAKYIQDRDEGVESDWQNVFLSTGASQCVKNILSLVNQPSVSGKPVGVMIPIPQYPLYSATLCEFGMHQADYYLDEDNDWSLRIDELERSYHENMKKSDIRVLVVVNPGNPTGSVLSEDNIIKILDFANKNNLVVIADEVYQHNIHDERLKFHSFKKVMFKKTNHRLELASIMSASKGYMGECGARGGYCELSNFSEDVRAILYKGLSSWLCSSVSGQITMDCIVKPPKTGEESYALFESEKNQILADLKRKAELVVRTFNSVEGVQLNKVTGAMYAFPRLSLPEKAIQEAKSKNYAPDFYYVLQFLENFGVCVVPGSGFGQKPGTYHFRTTILPQPDVFEDMMDRFREFHAQFLTKYS